MKNQHVSANKYNDHSIGNIKHYPRAKDFLLLQCHCCGLLNPQQNVDVDDQHCSRCHTALHLRKPYSLDRTLALVIAASILYIPANVLPMTMTDSLLGRQQDTIMSGVIYFWKSGDYLVSAVIFMASIFIPMLKLLILCFLLIAVRIQSFSRWNFSPEQCTLLYRVVEFIGRWSMIDVFVVALLTALIQIQSLATILAGPGAVAFGAVVVLTMFASLSFDPRIIWDNYYVNEARDRQQTIEKTSTVMHMENSIE
ncbi:paraquat-inducible protein A [Acinetobacter beijerinckii]|uniref:paraquat-inducible protein A n=1 Tax=Acinetobacter beijerinckii TaxID=262668 RepID=UPI00300916D8